MSYSHRNTVKEHRAQYKHLPVQRGLYTVMNGSTERWVTMPGNRMEVCCNIWRSDKEFYAWATGTNTGWIEHHTCSEVEDAVFHKTRQKVKMYRIHKMWYVGYVV